MTRTRVTRSNAKPALEAPESTQGVQRGYVLTFAIAGLPRMANGSHGSWRAKHARTLKWKVATKRAVDLNGTLPHAPLARAALTLTRYSSVEPDYDGLVIGFKPIIDALVEMGVLASDKPSCIHPAYFWEKAAPKRGRIEVKVESV